MQTKSNVLLTEQNDQECRLNGFAYLDPYVFKSATKYYKKSKIRCRYNWKWTLHSNRPHITLNHLESVFKRAMSLRRFKVNRLD